MNFCSACGSTVQLRIPQGEDRERYVCSACGVVHYENPRMVVGCIIEQEGSLLLCKRAIEPRLGYWTVPAGFLELGESTAEGALRETLEEAGAKAGIISPYAHFDIPHIGQAYIFYRARLLAPEFSAGTESLEVKWVAPQDIPWNDIAFHVVRVALELYVDDMRAMRYRLHHGVITKDDAGTYALENHLALSVARG